MSEPGSSPRPRPRPLPRHQPPCVRAPADRSALVALRKLQGFDTALRVLGRRLPRAQPAADLPRLRGAGRRDAVRPRCRAIVEDAAKVLDLYEVPEVFVVQDPNVNAYTLGIDRPWIVVTDRRARPVRRRRAALRARPRVRPRAVRARPSTGRCCTSSWRSPPASPGSPVGGWGLRAVVFALEEWQRAAELLRRPRRPARGAGRRRGAARAHEDRGWLALRDMDAGAFLTSRTTTATPRRPATASPSCSTSWAARTPVPVQRAGELRELGRVSGRVQPESSPATTRGRGRRRGRLGSRRGRGDACALTGQGGGLVRPAGEAAARRGVGRRERRGRDVATGCAGARPRGGSDTGGEPTALLSPARLGGERITTRAPEVSAPELAGAGREGQVAPASCRTGPHAAAPTRLRPVRAHPLRRHARRHRRRAAATCDGCRTRLRGARARPPGCSRPLIAAHRGAAELAPENTLPGAGVRDATASTCWRIDVQQTADGRYVLFHDLDVERRPTAPGSSPCSPSVRHAA
jgi:hypothetical protein